MFSVEFTRRLMVPIWVKSPVEMATPTPLPTATRVAERMVI